MRDSNSRSENGFTFDTCVAIKMCENPNLGSLLTCRVDFENSRIHLSSQTVYEAKRLGYDTDYISKQIQGAVGAEVIFERVSDEMYLDAQYLEKMCPTLHFGDSQILAYARASGTTLITCDRGLAEAAILSGTKVINPDILPCDDLRNEKPKLQKIVIRAIQKSSRAANKAKSLALKPGQKIVWRSFV